MLQVNSKVDESACQVALQLLKRNAGLDGKIPVSGWGSFARKINFPGSGNKLEKTVKELRNRGVVTYLSRSRLQEEVDHKFEKGDPGHNLIIVH